MERGRCRGRPVVGLSRLGEDRERRERKTDMAMSGKQAWTQGGPGKGGPGAGEPGPEGEW